MAFHRWRILIDWGGNGQWDTTAGSDEDVTDDVIGGIRASAGIDYGQVFPYAKAGRASFTLRNDHRRYSGYDASNPLGSGLQRAVLIQVWCASNTAFGAGGTYLPIWGGVVDYVRYGTSPSDLDTAEIFCIGNLGGLNDADISVDLSSVSVAEIGETLAEAVWPNTRITSTGNAAFRYLMAGGRPQVEHYLRTSNSPTIPSYVYDGRALAGLRSLAQDTGSRLFEGPDGAVRLYSTAAQSSLESGAARFTLRHTSTATSASTYHVSAATPEIARRDVINRVSVGYIETGRRTAYTSSTAYGRDAQIFFANFDRDLIAYDRSADGTFTRYIEHGDIQAGTLENAGQSTAYLSYAYTVVLPQFERNDPTPGVVLASVDTFSLREFEIGIALTDVQADQPSIVRTRSGYDDNGYPQLTAYRWRGSVDLVPGTEYLAAASDNRADGAQTYSSFGDRFNWRADSASRTASRMQARLLLSRVSLHEYTLTVRLERLHPDLILSPVPDLRNLRVLLTGWTVQTPPQPATHTQTDTSSVASHGLQSYDARVDWITTESQARAYATRILNARSAPTSRYRVSYLLDQKASLTDIPQVSDIVDLEYRGTTTKCWVDSARHDISKRRHRCELLLTPV